MELTVTKRAVGKKSEAKKARREGKIPAIIYSKGEKGADITLDTIAFKKILNTIVPGTLSSKVFTLKMDGKDIRAIVKDIQYHPTSYDILHIDFVELHDDIPVSINIPLQCTNVVDCAGIKLGGVLRQVVRHVRVRCLPKAIPSHFEIDVLNLVIGQTVKLNKITIPEGVHPITDLKDVAVVIAKK